MDTDPTEETVPVSVPPPDSPRPASPLGRFLRSVPGALGVIALFLAVIITAAIWSGYQAGTARRSAAAATAQVLELKRQFELGVEDLAAGRYALAAQRFEYILTMDPNYPGAAAHLAEARNVRLPTPLPTATPGPSPTPDPDIAKKLLVEAQTAFAAKDWSAAITKASAVRVADPGYEPGQVNSILFNSYRNRGIDSIKSGVLELGLADLDQASKLGTLDAEALQYQQWANLYVSGVSYWGLNWARTVDTFSVLYQIAPYFRDTGTRLHDAHIGYANALMAGGDPCNAADEYAAALVLSSDQATVDKQTAAATECAVGTSTPTATSETGATPTLTPDAAATMTPTSTVTQPAANTAAPAITDTPNPSPTSTSTSTSTSTDAATATATATSVPTDTLTPNP